MIPVTSEMLSQYQALTAGVGLADLSDRTQLELTGDDRASFLHNLCTNEIKKLPVGGGCEAFITNVQGRTIGHGYVFCRTASLVFDTVPGQGDILFTHLDRYHIREKVEIHNRSQWGELLFAGPHATDLLERLGITAPAGRGQAEGPFQITNFDATLDGVAVSIRRVDLVGPKSYFISAESAEIPNVTDALRAAGAIDCSGEAIEMARVEAGTPLFGRDITDKNLPQEVGRDARAISFTKGCYLGQETVARIDALGHVNQLLVGVRFGGGAIAAGTELLSGEKVAGHVTSSAWSPRLSALLALAYVRREASKPGTALASSFGNAQVVALPLA